MSACALLGSTGSTGLLILDILLARPDTQVQTLVRSPAKLKSQLSDGIPHNLTIYEGTPSDIELLARCLKGTRALFITLGPVGNPPGCSLMQDMAKDLVAAMRSLQETSPDAKLPHVVMLSAAPLNEQLSRGMPRPVRSVLFRALHWHYTDLKIAEEILRRESDWISCTFVKPGGLVHDEPKGHILTMDQEQPFLSYADLAAGMVEVSEGDGGYWDQKDVSVISKSPARFGWENVLILLKGFITYWLPWSYQYLF
ncbi:hypothetical protein F5Y15DRAFT_318267 [Xylariaceae sp. FL0016]|nr:hypothetical protein F5Y15DRAFT_318267 [Xylariaceae sp. FL0016]